jgi:hypothetical protein
VVEEVVTDIVELPPLVTEVGLKVAFAPAGSPATLNATELAAPCVVAVLTEYDVPEPAVTVWLAGVAPIEKSLGAFTTSVTFCECVRLPLVPVTVSV